MASLKSLLETTMLKLGSSGSQVKDSAKVEISGLVANAYNYYTAPCDGFLVQDITSAPTGDESYLWFRQGSWMANSARAIGVGKSQYMYSPVPKGVTCRFQFMGYDISKCAAYFLKSVGGAL